MQGREWWAQTDCIRQTQSYQAIGSGGLGWGGVGWEGEVDRRKKNEPSFIFFHPSELPPFCLLLEVVQWTYSIKVAPVNKKKLPSDFLTFLCKNKELIVKSKKLPKSKFDCTIGAVTPQPPHTFFCTAVRTFYRVSSWFSSGRPGL